MPNPLAGLPVANPPAPNPQPQAQSQPGNALSGPPSGVSAQGQQPQLPPAPTHAQTVTALRHFTALESELSELMADPDLGKTDMRSKVIDGMTRLVAEGIVPPAGAVKDMGTFPEKPYDQRQWVNQHFMNVVQAQTAILAHHQLGAMQGQPVGSEEPSPDDHQTIMSGLQGRYSGGT
jgi:hypothetical protein